MRDPEAVVSLAETLEGVGDVEAAGEHVARASFLLRRSKSDPEGPWTVTLHFTEDMTSKWSLLHRPGWSTVRLHGWTDSGQEIRVEGLRLDRASKFREDATAQEVLIGPEALSLVPQRQHVSVSLTPTPLALPADSDLALHETGEIKSISRKSRSREPMIVPLAIGAARFSRLYEFEEARVNRVPSLVRVPLPSISIVVSKEARSRNIRELLTRVTTELDDTLRVMTFLSRRFVRWTTVRVRASRRTRTRAEYSDTSLVRPIQSSQKSDGHHSPLVNPYRLPTDSLGRLSVRFSSLPYKDSAAAAVTYLTAMHETNVLDIQFVLAFTALESLIDGIGRAEGSERTLGSSAFKALRRTLEPTILAFASAHKLSEDRSQELLEKVGELQRRPMAARVCEQLRQNGIEWADLWPTDTQLDDAIRAALGRRNKFIHGGRLPAFLQARADAVRISILTERLLFKLLGGDPAWHDHTSFEEARHMSDAHVNEEIAKT